MEKTARKLRKSLIVIPILSIGVGILSYISYDINQELDSIETQVEGLIEVIDEKDKEINNYKSIIQLKDEANNELVEKNNQILKSLEDVKKLNEKLAMQKMVEEKKVAEAKKIAEKKKKEVTVSRSSNEGNSPSIVFEGTSYTAFCNSGCIGITATGYNVKNTIYYQGYRVIAVDPKVIPLYSIVRISYGDTSFKAIALDTGGAIKGHRIDILTDSNSKATEFGRRNISVKILSYGK